MTAGPGYGGHRWGAGRSLAYRSELGVNVWMGGWGAEGLARGGMTQEDDWEGGKQSWAITPGEAQI